jgi:hypothetical protein
MVPAKDFTNGLGNTPETKKDKPEFPRVDCNLN